MTGAGREAPPVGGTPRDFVLPAREEFALPNGLQACLVPWGAIPKATVSLVVRAGNIDESADEVWLADLMGDLLDEGTEVRSGRELAEAGARMGGSLRVGVGLDRSSLTADVLGERAPDMVRLMAEVVRRPRFPADALERRRQDRLRELAIARQQPSELTLEAFRAALYPGHPYGRTYPSEAQLAGYTLDQVREFHRRTVGAARARLYVAGRFDPSLVRQAIEEALGDWRAGSPPLDLVPTPVGRRELRLIDRPGAAQSTLMLGTPVIDPSHPDWVALQVTNSLLGGSFASRITSNIREDKGYTYSPSSSISTRHRDAYWAESADVATEVTGAAVGEIEAEIARLATEPPAPDELAGIQAHLAGTFVLQNSSRQGLIAQKAFIDLHGLPAAYLDEFVRRVHAVTPEDVTGITARFLRPGQLLLVVTGDRARVEPQLAHWSSSIP